MTRLLLMALTSATIAFTPVTATPARAETLNGSDLAKVLGTIAVLGIIGAQISKNRRDDDKKRVRVHTPRHRAQIVTRHRGGRKAARGLPAACAHRIHGQRHDRIVYGDKCLRRQFRGYRHLPRHCASRVHAYGRVHTVFGARCLRRTGWTLARRH